MRPAEFEGFFFLCPANDDDRGWHHGYSIGPNDTQPCSLCGRLVKWDDDLGRLRYDVPFLWIYEVPW